jgi:hypothetical protein
MTIQGSLEVGDTCSNLIMFRNWYLKAPDWSGLLFCGPSILDDLPLANKRGPLNIEIDLILNITHGIDDGFDGGVADLPGVHADADFVADFVGFGRHEATVAEWVLG